MFRNRQDAAQQLAAHRNLAKYKGQADKVIVIGLPRGGIPIAATLAKSLSVPFDMVVPRKIGHPEHEEYAMGALTESGEICWNEKALRYTRLRKDDPRLLKIVEQEKAEAKRRLAAYRGNRPPLDLKEKVVILVDDGIATGATMKAAVASAKAAGASHVVIAVPVAAPDSVTSLQQQADQVITLAAPEWFSAVGQFYDDFSQTEDSEVLQLMRESAQQAQQQQSRSSATARTQSSTSSEPATAPCELSDSALADIGLADLDKTRVPADMRGSHDEIEKEKSTDII